MTPKRTLILLYLRDVVCDSPMVWISIGLCCWCYVRSVLWTSGVISAKPPFLEISFVSFVGSLTGLAGVIRSREDGWYLGPLASVANVAVWLIALINVKWTFYFSS